MSVAAVVAVAVSLSACATRPGSTASATPTSVSSASPEATASASPTAVPSPEATDIVPPAPTPPAADAASVTIVNSGADGKTVSASGLVTGAKTTDGVCTLTATSRSGQTLTGTVQAMSTPAAVNCGLIDIEAPAGDWELVLSYRDGDATVSSAPVTVTQP